MGTLKKKVTQFNTIIIMLSMFKVLLLAACVAFVVGEDDYYLDAGTPPATTTTADQVATTTTAVAATTTTTALSIFRCKECDDWMACAGNHFLTVVSVDLERVPAVDGTNGDCAKTTGILNPLLSVSALCSPGPGIACAPSTAYFGCHGGGYIVKVGNDVSTVAICDATADAINQKIAGAAVVAKVACQPPNYIGNMLFVPGDITACKPVACALNDLVGAFDPDFPVPTAAPAFTQITQTVVQNVPGVDARRAAMNVQYISAATFNADLIVKSAYQKAYGSMIGITDTDSTTNAVTYKTGCSVDAYATDARRAAMNVKYISVVSDTSGVDTTTASNGVTDTTTSGSVTPPSASDII